MWIETKEQLPEPGIPVLVFVQRVFGDKTRRLRALYAAKYSLEQGAADESDPDYDEKTDQYYCKTGWYEANEGEDVHWKIEGDVTHWMPLPDPPIACCPGCLDDMRPDANGCYDDRLQELIGEEKLRAHDEERCSGDPDLCDGCKAELNGNKNER